MGAAETLGGSDQNRFRDAVRIVVDLIVPESDDSPALSFEKGRSPAVVAFGLQVLRTVEFDAQPRLAAGKVQNVGSHNKLAGKGRPIARKPSPDEPFSRRGRVAQLSRTLRHFLWNPAHVECLVGRATLAYPPPAPPFQGGGKRI